MLIKNPNVITGPLMKRRLARLTVEVEIPGIGILSNPVAAEFDASAI